MGFGLGYGLGYQGNSSGKKKDGAVIGQLSIILIPNNVLCNGGSTGEVNLLVSGGIPPYTYSWNTGATTGDISNLVAGTYTVTVTDSVSTVVSGSTTISEPNIITITETVTDVSTYGGGNGSISLSVSGGNGLYTYLWSNGATTSNISSLSSGTYTVTVTDHHGCTAEETYAVLEPIYIQLISSTNTSVIGANDGSIDITVAGGLAPYTYSWSNGATTQDITGLDNGVYNITVTDANNETASESFSIYDPLTVTLNSKTNTTILGSNDGSIDITVAGGLAPYTYSWSNGATTQDITGLTSGNYSVIVTDANNETASSSYIIYDPLTVTLNSKTNPSSPGSNDGSIDITVAGGLAPYAYSWSNGATTQDITGLIDGTYNVTVTDSLSSVKTLEISVAYVCPYGVKGSSQQIGTYYNYGSVKPFNGLYNYSVSASIYSPGQFTQAACQITGLQFYVRSFTIPYTVNNQEIWIGEISNSTFPSSTPNVDFSDLTFIKPLTKVTTKNVTITNNLTWVNVNFDTPYCYAGTNNLILVWKNLDGSWSSGYGQAQQANIVSRGMFKVSDISYPTGTGTRDNFPLLVKFNY